MIDENKDMICMTSDLKSDINCDLNSQSKAIDNMSSVTEDMSGSYVPSEARKKAMKSWSFGDQMPLTPITKSGLNGHKIKRKMSPKKAKTSPKKPKTRPQFDINSEEYKSLIKGFEESIETVIKSSDSEMDDLNGLNHQNKSQPNIENEDKVSNGLAINSFNHSFESLVNNNNRNELQLKSKTTKRVRKTSKLNAKTLGLMSDVLTNSSDNTVVNDLNSFNNSINGLNINDFNDNKLCETNEEIKPKPKPKIAKNLTENDLKIQSKRMNNSMKTNPQLFQQFMKNKKDLSSNSLQCFETNNNSIKYKFVKKLATIKTETQRMAQKLAQKKVKQSKSFKTSNVKIVNNKTKPLVVKDLQKQKSFLDFIDKKYPPIKDGIPFIQDRSCKDFTKCKDFESSEVYYCLDCNDNRNDSKTCRFYHYRTLIRSNGKLKVYAFAEEANATKEDSNLWVPTTTPKNLDPINAKYLMTFVAQELCRIYTSERKICEQSTAVTWKKPVKGIRELCDVCLTTIFNTHYVCPKCGFAVCVDCYDGRKTEPMDCHQKRKNHDEFGWIYCHNKERHDLDGFHLAIFFTKNIFKTIDYISHKIRNDLQIYGLCGCHQIQPQFNVDLKQMTANLDLKHRYPQVPQQWLCDERMLVLTDPKCSGNLGLFQMFWLKGYPVMIESVDKLLNARIWSPDMFNEKFGRQSSRLVNCMNGLIIPNRPMSDFWNGFEDVDNRLEDVITGEDMILKLKDWPPTEEFRDKLPIWFDDLMEAIPLKEYTRYDGNRNLASRLPDFFVRPDLGPKMYCAYGSVLHTDKGTTNLHLDMSDAVNVMIYVGVAKSYGIPLESHLKCANDLLLRGGCDQQMMSRANSTGLKVGALWHIWKAEDADKMRDFLQKVAKERGLRSETNNDPIHDQSWYLDETLRTRLEVEYGVKGCAIAQCLGDAILVPAGAPHQVQNVHSCIKVAGEFVSPENISHCLSLTHEFRRLSKRHNNHEDKLQIKNIIYHTIKDSLALLCPSNQPIPVIPSAPQPMTEIPIASTSQMPNEFSEPSLALTPNAHNIPPTPPNSSEKACNESIVETPIDVFDNTLTTSNICDTNTTNTPIIDALNESNSALMSELTSNPTQETETSESESTLILNTSPVPSDDSLSSPPILTPFYESDSNHKSGADDSTQTCLLNQMQTIVSNLN